MSKIIQVIERTVNGQSVIYGLDSKGTLYALSETFGSIPSWHHITNSSPDTGEPK